MNHSGNSKTEIQNYASIEGKDAQGYSRTLLYFEGINAKYKVCPVVYFKIK